MWGGHSCPPPLILFLTLIYAFPDLAPQIAEDTINFKAGGKLTSHVGETVRQPQTRQTAVAPAKKPRSGPRKAKRGVQRFKSVMQATRSNSLGFSEIA